MYDGLDVIPIFFAVDNGYIPFLAVSLQSLISNSSQKYHYSIKILHVDVTEENKNIILKYQKNNVDIEFVDLNYYIEKIKNKLYTRDYFTPTTYFRLFISNLYPHYTKAIYLDCDVVLLGDVAELYHTELGTNLVGAVPDDIIQCNKVFQEYVEKVVGVSSYKNYFNAGVLVMNLDQLRKFDFQDKFLYLLSTIKFAVVQDQDYLNRLCKGRVTLIDKMWNTMPMSTDKTNVTNIKLIHFNYVYKPWHYDNIMYQNHFWKYAEQTEFVDFIKDVRNNYSEDEKFEDKIGDKRLRELAQKESDCVGDDRPFKEIEINITNNSSAIDKSPDRLRILEKIQKLEEDGHFDIDAEEDPPTIPLTPDNVDYLREKMYSKFKNKLANRVGERFLKELLKNSKLIIKDVYGLENLQAVETGAMITCNHFNPFDSFAIENVFRQSGQSKNKKLFKVIREGNYTNFSGLYGFFFRNCDTLPLSSNRETMASFIKAVDTILQRGDFILIYPEQSLWWNYKKPKPLKNGAFNLAARNNVPILPVFITMEDSDVIGEDGFPIQEYTINIEKAIYPDATLSQKENTENMKNKNYTVWKKIYEDFYQIPLEYTTKNQEESLINEN